MVERTSFWSESVAHDWEHGLVAGTGTLGAVLFGDPARHRVVVCHEEHFLRANPTVPAPDLTPRLAELRAAALAGDAAGAAATLEQACVTSGYDGTLVWTDPFIPVGELAWTPDDASYDETSYRRSGDFRSGRVAARWRTPVGETWEVALVPDRAAGTMHLELTSQAGGSGELRIGPGDEPGADDAWEVDYTTVLVPEAPTILPHALGLGVEVDPAALTELARRFPPSRWAPRRARLTVRVPDDVACRTTPTGLRLVLEPGRTARLPIEVELTGGRATPGGPATDHAELVDRCGLDLGGALPDASYDAVLAAARSGDPSALLGAIELAFAAGRHTIVSSTGHLPATLVGVWQGTRRPAWSGDYTQNGNVQHGGVASLVASGTPELLLPYFEAIARHGEDYASNARRLFGAPGWLLPARFDTHGHMNHVDASYPNVFWVGAGGWAVRLGWDYFSATGDTAFLTGHLWPLAREVMACYAAITVPVDGVRHLAPSYSPENTPAGWANPITVDATMDVAIIRDTARVAARVAGLVEAEGEAEAWQDVVDRLPPYRVAEDGTFAEWLWPGTPEQIAHRHVSQLYPFWYEDDPAADSPELREAARETIRRKLAWRAAEPSAPPEGRLEMAFGFVGLGLAAARLGEADLARECVEWLARDHWRPNAVSTHDADAIFNVDASGGLPAVVLEMLVQSQPNELALLPALPAAWPSGTVRGVRARGGVVVERLSWDPEGVRATLATVPGSAAARRGDRVRVTVPGSPPEDVDLRTGPVEIRVPR